MDTLHFNTSRTTQSLVILSLVNDLQRFCPRWEFYQRGSSLEKWSILAGSCSPAIILAGNSSILAGSCSPAIILAGKCAVQRLCWTGYGKFFFFQISKIFQLAKICNKKICNFVLSCGKNSLQQCIIPQVDFGGCTARLSGLAQYVWAQLCSLAAICTALMYRNLQLCFILIYICGTPGCWTRRPLVRRQQC